MCAGTQGQFSFEDVLGAGAIIAAIDQRMTTTLVSDAALMARQLFQANRTELPAVLRQTLGGRNIIAAGLEPDIDFAARLDAFDNVGVVVDDPPVVRRWKGI